MRSRSQGSSAMMWVALTTAGVIAATYLMRRNGRRRAERAAEAVTGTTHEEAFVDETLEESFPASDPASWGSVSR